MRTHLIRAVRSEYRVELPTWRVWLVKFGVLVGDLGAWIVDRAAMRGAAK